MTAPRSPLGSALPADPPSANDVAVETAPEDAEARSPATAAAHSGGAIARNASHLALGQLGTTVLAVVFSAALGRLLGARDFGLYFLVTSMATFGFVFVEWGQGPLVIAEAARAPERTGELIGTALALRVAMTAAVAIPLILIARALDYDARTLWLLALYFVAMLPLSLAQGFGMAFRAHDRMDRDAIVSVLNRFAGLLFALAVLFRGGAVTAVAFAQLGAGLVCLGVARRFYRNLGAGPLTVTARRAKALLVDGAPILAMVVSSAVQPYIDAIILSKMVPGEVVGWYGVAKTILGTLIAPAVILGAASYPQLARVASDGRRFRDELNGALRPILLVGALGMTGTFLFAGTAVHIIYGKAAYQSAADIIQVFSPGMFLLFVDVLLGNALLAAGRARFFTIAKVVSVVVSTILDYLLIPWFHRRYGNGGIGIVVAFGLSEFIVFAGCWLLLPRGVLGSRFAVDSAKAIAAAVLTVLAIRAVALWDVVAIPLAIALFCVVAFAFGLIKRSDIAVVSALVRRREAPPSLQP